MIALIRPQTVHLGRKSITFYSVLVFKAKSSTCAAKALFITYTELSQYETIISTISKEVISVYRCSQTSGQKMRLLESLVSFNLKINIHLFLLMDYNPMIYRFVDVQ